MANFLFASATFVLAMVALGLFRILYGPGEADRMMAAQLVGTGGVAVLLLMSVATATPSTIDVALILALLAAFALIAFVRSASGAATEDREAPDPR
ncbi:MAG TPA: monovalent cation/H+ antiporter complex subunit F [Xanthobacteraceae bacterium]|nr:monovalent cation/H+ antiporter complex subunit F [Xanthobacteraceae bacterium]